MLGATADSTSGHQAKIVNLDDRVTFGQQLEHNVGPVVLMSTFLVAPEHVDEFLEGFKKQFAIMRKQPGLISAQLHRGIAGSSLFMNYIVWETVDAFRRGFELPEFQAQLKQYPRFQSWLREDSAYRCSLGGQRRFDIQPGAGE